jgi:hypothetical protein
MAETSRTSVIAASGVRPPAHGFERTRRNADRAPTLAIMPGPANDGPSGADGGTSDSDQTRTGEGRSHAVTTGPSRRAVLRNERDGQSHAQ